MTTRLPSFNDFSPGILKNDMRHVLRIVDKYSPDEVAIVNKWKEELFPDWDDKRVRTNITATLSSTGLIDGRPMKLSAFGKNVKSANSARKATEIFCTEIIKNRNGKTLIEAISNLSRRGERVTKETLQVELVRLGITDLSNNTTDHTTLKNWMIQAGIVVEVKQGLPTVVDTVLKTLTGISNSESTQIQSLTLAQQVFLHLLRKYHLTAAGPFNIEALYTECRALHPHQFASADLAKAVKDPLALAKWIEVDVGTAKGRGGKSGWVVGTKKLLSIPIENFIPDFDATVPSDLHSKLQTPLSQIKTWLDGSDTHQGGLGLELLALRIILDLRLIPRGFRARSKETAYAEVDVTAEGDHLMFSRWTFQCKRIQSNKNVGLGDVAKEVGIAIYMRAHVVAMVSTGGFSREALAYAKQIAATTSLQFVFLDGKVVRNYLASGPAVLHDFVMKNAKAVMLEKGRQATDLSAASE